MTNPNTTTSNQELLSWAVENIKEWDDDYTHLRSDDSRHSLFFSIGSFIKDEDGTWCYDSRNGDVWDVSVIYDKSFCTKPAQVITKQEWLEGVALLKHYDGGLTSASEAQQGHVHAELMAEYALVAKTNPEPWKEFEESWAVGEWAGCSEKDMIWHTACKYRRKPTPPKTMNIGGVIVEAWPLEKMPPAGLSYWALIVEDNAKFDVDKFINDQDSLDEAILHAGKAFSTKEQAQAVADALNLVYNRAIGRGEG